VNASLCNLATDARLDLHRKARFLEVLLTVRMIYRAVVEPLGRIMFDVLSQNGNSRHHSAGVAVGAKQGQAMYAASKLRGFPSPAESAFV